MSLFKKIALLSTCTVVMVLFTVKSVSGQIEPVSLQQALERANPEGKKILVDVYASWCPYCQRMHSNVYPSDEVQEAIEAYYLWVQIDIESKKEVNYHGNTMTQAEFARALSNESVPTTYFLNKRGEIIGAQPGFIETPTFSKLLHFVGSDAYLEQPFSEYEGPE